MKVIILLSCLLLSFSSFAKTVARVIDIKGNAFVFSEDNTSKSLRYGSKVQDLSEVMVEDGSALSLINNEGHVFHVNGGTLFKFYNGIAEVKNGQVWVVVKELLRGPGTLHTPNSIAKYTEGQFIYSYDNHTGKTQALVLTGDVKFSNALEPAVSINVPAGHFSIVERDFDKGLPRSPTKVGLKSYKKFKNLFVNFDSLQDSKIENMLWEKPSKTKARSIASVSDQFSLGGSAPAPRRGKIIKITTYKSSSRVPASVSPMSYYKQIKKRENALRKPAQTDNGVQIKYWGYKWKKPAQVKKPVLKKSPKKKQHKMVIKTNLIQNPLKEIKRKPAAVGSQAIIRDLSNTTSDFERTLQKSAQQEKRHAAEVNSLIDDLKSYKQDYKKEY